MATAAAAPTRCASSFVRASSTCCTVRIDCASKELERYSECQENGDEQFAIRVFKAIEQRSARHRGRERCRGWPSRLKKSQGFPGSSYEGRNQFRRLLPHSQ